jgi:hypothetical protein
MDTRSTAYLVFAPVAGLALVVATALGGLLVQGAGPHDRGADRPAHSTQQTSPVAAATAAGTTSAPAA